MIYTFGCENCDIEFEIECSMKSFTGKANCPDCNKDAFRIFEEPMFAYDSTAKTVGTFAERNKGAIGSIQDEQGKRHEQRRKFIKDRSGHDIDKEFNTYWDKPTKTKRPLRKNNV